MIASLRGTLLDKTAEQAVIECAGVGYQVFMSLSSLSQLGPVGNEVVVLVYTHVTSETHRLYGFLEPAERRTFEVLISITRVGPKLAIAVLSAMSPGELADAVARGDAAAISGIPGVGKKTADRLLLELRDKLRSTPTTTLGTAAKPSDTMGDLVSALVNLGFKDSVAERAASQAMAGANGEGDLATLVREALRATTRR